MGGPTEQNNFVVNHFVPLFRQNHPSPSLMSNPYKTKLDGEWKEVKKKKTQGMAVEKPKYASDFNKQQTHSQMTQRKGLKRKTTRVKT